MAEAALDSYGLPRQVDPMRGLLEELWRTAGHVAWLEERIRALDPSALVWGAAKRVNAPTAVTIGRGEQMVESTSTESAAVSVWLNLYARERKHFVEVCTRAIACGIVEREVQLAEEQGRLIAKVIIGALEDLGIDLGDDGVRNVIRRHLLPMADGAVATS